MAGPIGRGRRLVHVVEQQHGLARLDVAQLDAVGKAGARIGHQPARAVARELGVAQAIEADEGAGSRPRMR
ncbi:MAG: hypothetical protein U1F30_15760 [Steroidobacteraceae bacterium]